MLPRPNVEAVSTHTKTGTPKPQIFSDLISRADLSVE